MSESFSEMFDALEASLETNTSLPPKEEWQLYTVGGYLGSSTFDCVDVTKLIFQAPTRPHASLMLMKKIFDEDWIEKQMKDFEEEYEWYLDDHIITDEDGKIVGFESYLERDTWFFRAMEGWGFDCDTVWLREAELV